MCGAHGPERGGRRVSAWSDHTGTRDRADRRECATARSRAVTVRPVLCIDPPRSNPCRVCCVVQNLRATFAVVVLHSDSRLAASISTVDKSVTRIRKNGRSADAARRPRTRGVHHMRALSASAWVCTLAAIGAALSGCQLSLSAANVRNRCTASCCACGAYKTDLNASFRSWRCDPCCIAAISRIWKLDLHMQAGRRTAQVDRRCTVNRGDTSPIAIHAYTCHESHLTLTEGAFRSGFSRL